MPRISCHFSLKMSKLGPKEGSAEKERGAEEGNPKTVRRQGGKVFVFSLRA